jgi:hypothetical protein
VSNYEGVAKLGAQRKVAIGAVRNRNCIASFANAALQIVIVLRTKCYALAGVVAQIPRQI